MKSMKIGDSVKVKKGVLEPDTEKFEIGGWQGRILVWEREHLQLVESLLSSAVSKLRRY